jgi:carbamoyltransferase
MDGGLWVVYAPSSIVYHSHRSLSHAASAFFCSPYGEAAILTVDGVGEWTTATIGRGTAVWERPQTRDDGRQTTGDDPSSMVHSPSSNTIELFNEVRFPHSLGLLYSAFTAFLGFRVNSGEYKVMGMAPYGQPNERADRVW